MTDLTQIDRFVRTLAEHEKEFGIELSASDLACLSDYYRIVMRENALLHLVAPCSPEEFAVRHILESLTTLEFLPSSARFADVGAGAGLPSLPCLLVREGLRGLLIESKQKKAGFLGRAISELRLEARASVAPTQFQEVEDKDLDAVASVLSTALQSACRDSSNGPAAEGCCFLAARICAKACGSWAFDLKKNLCLYPSGDTCSSSITSRPEGGCRAAYAFRPSASGSIRRP
jgi:hypothetical protein